MVDTLIANIVKCGGNTNYHVDWDEISKMSLDIVKTKEVEIKKPSFKHYEWHEYKVDFPTGLTQENRALGDRCKQHRA